MNVLIAEDEAIAADFLKNLLDEIGFIYDSLETVPSVAALKRRLGKKPELDLLFLDVELQDGRSLEVFEQGKLSTPVIFTSAYDDYAMNAFKANSLDYLLKPLDARALTTALNKYRVLRHFYNDYPSGRKERIVGRKGTASVSVPLSTVAFFYTEDKITYAVVFEGTRYRVDYSLTDIEAWLNPKVFFKATRRFIVNVDALKDFKPSTFSKIDLFLKPNGFLKDAVTISQYTAPHFRRWLENL